MHVDNSLWEANVEHDSEFENTKTKHLWFTHDEGMYNWAKRTTTTLYNSIRAYTRRMDKYVIR